MKIKTNGIEFVSFSDGICKIFMKDNDNNKTYKYNNLGFEDRVLGYKRYFEGKARQIEINRVIRIPNVPGIDNYDYVEIGNVDYGIKLVQPITDTNPMCIDLTLDKMR